MAYTNDNGIGARIKELVAEEHRLRSHPNPSDEDLAALKSAENELDQCWDLLRQRRAKTETGADPGDAKARSVPEVEGYLQ
ncbi:MAG: hypothetical protein AUG49_08515 [Catenulispora sp. 13_1_20CM_3_70_7]|nr:DUF2630 family protein [Catenulisporales bacterium]OLE26313.1 MAG: hypothetical protein AUG49_08515 [Catenulispora sp. 13_1_20CM_3_70_7]